MSLGNDILHARCGPRRQAHGDTVGGGRARGRQFPVWMGHSVRGCRSEPKREGDVFAEDACCGVGGIDVAEDAREEAVAGEGGFVVVEGLEVVGAEVVVSFSLIISMG